MRREIGMGHMRRCDWTGEERTGKFYLLATTEGTEAVSEEAFLDGDFPELVANRVAEALAEAERKRQQEEAERLEAERGELEARPPVTRRSGGRKTPEEDGPSE